MTKYMNAKSFFAVCFGIFQIFACAHAQTISQLVSTHQSRASSSGQSFTATMTGEVHAISLASVIGGTYNLHIYAGNSGSGVAGVGTPLYTQTITLTATPIGSLPERIDLLTPFAVVANSQYTFIVEGDAWLHATLPEVYPGGAWVYSFNSIEVLADLTFAVYERIAVAPTASAAPIPSSSWGHWWALRS